MKTTKEELLQRNEYQKLWYKKNPELAKKNRRNSYLKRKEKMKLNPEMQARERERCRLKSIEYSQLHPDKLAAYRKLPSTKARESNRMKAKRSAYTEEERERARVANRGVHYKAKYGITIADYEARLTSQNGRCAICKGEEVGHRWNSNRLHVDHDHSSGAIRGLLCTKCNRGIGLFNDDPKTMAAAIEYLKSVLT